MYEQIIVGYDGSDEAADALAFGRAVAESTGGTLVLARTFPFDPVDFDPVTAEPAGYRTPPEVALLEIEMDRIAAEIRAVADANGAEISVLPASSAVRGLHDLAEERHASLIVVGSARRGGLGTVLLGTVGERLIHGAPCAVAVAPRGFRGRETGESRVIAVAFDGSSESSQALEAAAELARKAQATIRLLAVPSPSAPESRLGEELLRARDGLSAELRAAAHMLHGPPAAAVAEEAEKAVDVLFVGSRGYGPLRRAMLGSFSSALMSLAPCPVVVTPRAAVEANGLAPDAAPRRTRDEDA